MSLPIEQLEGLANGFADAVDAAGSATVMVLARRRMPSTGIVYANDLIVTANHTIEREEDVKIGLANGDRLPAVLAGRDPARDIALLRVKDAALKPAQTSKTPPRIGQLVLALGRPDDNGIQASLGVVSAAGGPVRIPHGGTLEKYLRTDTIPFPGFSGGPLVAINGSILGMNTSGLAMETLITIPVDVLWQAAETLAAHGHIRRPYLGIRSQKAALAASQQEALNRKQENGLLLIGIEDNSPASTAGLLVGDILVGFNDHEITDHEELQDRISEQDVGKTILIELLRGGKPLKVQVTVGER